MQKNKEYWAKRALKREQESFARGAKLTTKLFQEYQIAAKAIRKAVNDYYAKYAAKHGLTYEDAIKLLNRRENQEWKADLEEYIAQIAAETDPEVKARLTAHLDALSYNSSITRLDALQGQIDMILNNLYSDGVAQMREEFSAELLESYYHKVYDLQSRAGFIGEFARFDSKMIEDIVSYPWSGADYSARLWQNTQALAFHAREITTQGVIQGKSIAAMSKELSDKMGQSYKAAERLVRTEQGHIHNEADIRAYEAAGVEEYEFMATLEVRTCEVCGTLDGKHFPLGKKKEGVNFPLMHPNCRCSTVEYDPDDAMDWYNSGVPMPKDMTYTEWYEQQVKEHGAGWVEQERKKAYNTAKDKAQYEKIQKNLGKNAPRSFQDFQNIKYGGDYDTFKAYSRSMKSGELTPLADFELYKNTSKQIDGSLVGIKTSEGVVITGKSDHFISRVIGSVEQRRSGVEIEAIKDALQSPSKISKKESKKGTSVLYTGKHIAVSVNPDTGILIQTNPVHGKKGSANE